MRPPRYSLFEMRDTTGPLRRVFSCRGGKAMPTFVREPTNLFSEHSAPKTFVPAAVSSVWTTIMPSTFIIAALASIFAMGAASAQTPASTPTMDKAAMSKSCSSQADAKGLHGKARKHFRSACKHGH